MTMGHMNCETGSAGGDLPGFASRILHRAYHVMKMRSERAALHAMPDYMLKDLGIARSEINYFTSMRYTASDRMGAKNVRP